MRWLAWDAVVVLVFAAVGRASHDEGLTLGGWAHTAWPFLAGVFVGWGLVGWLLARRRGGSVRAGVMRGGSLRGGAVVWVATVVVGMLLRVVTGAGTAAAFIVVATVFLAACFLVPRAVAVRLAQARRPL